MDEIVDKLVEHIKKNNIKIVTITESNHRSYTSHTFHFRLAKKLYEQGIIDTFSSERMGINDAEIIDYYLKHNLDIETLHSKLPFGGMGYYRFVKYFSKKPYGSYKIVGLEEDRYCFNIYDGMPRGFKGIDYKAGKDREKFWLKNMKKVLKERGNLFINGFHMAKNDPIGEYLKKHHAHETLFLAMGAFDIKTQVLIVDKEEYPKEKDFDRALIYKDYITKVENINKISKPTSLEKKYKDWKLVKVNDTNKNLTFRAVGCFLALYNDEYAKGENLTPEISFKIKNYDYFIFFKKSIYKEKMFY